MKLDKAPPILSRILLAISSLILVGVIFVYVSRALEPAIIAPPSPQRSADAFNPKADVSKNPAFQKLQEENMDAVPDMPMGRENPFISIQNPAKVTSSTAGLTVPRSGLRIAPADTGVGSSEGVNASATSTTL